MNGWVLGLIGGVVGVNGWVLVVIGGVLGMNGCVLGLIGGVLRVDVFVLGVFGLFVGFYGDLVVSFLCGGNELCFTENIKNYGV